MDIIFRLEEIEQAAKKFIEATSLHKVFLFEGEMGTGKTTFIRELCRQYGVTENVTSPTFAIINEYRGSEDKIIFHLDLYRLNNIDEASQAGVEECLFSGETCYVEWPSKASELMPEDALYIKLQTAADNSRKLTLHTNIELADIR